MKKKVSFKVSVDLPDGCKIAEMRDYIEESVATWKGCKHPEEPIFDLDWKSVKVTRILEKKQSPPNWGKLHDIADKATLNSFVSMRMEMDKEEVCS